MNSINFSKSYHVRMLIERDIPHRDMALEAGSSQSCVCICTVWVTSISGWVMWMATSKVNRSGKRISSQIPD